MPNVDAHLGRGFAFVAISSSASSLVPFGTVTATSGVRKIKADGFD